MENSSISLASIREAATNSSGAYGNPYLRGGYLIGSSVLGLLVIIGAFLYNRRNLSLFKRSCAMSCKRKENHLKGVQLIHSSLGALLILNAMNLIVASIYGAFTVALICGETDCILYENVWFISRWFGVILHLVNASLSINHLRQPLSVARFRITYVLVSVVIIIMVPLFLYVYKVPMFILAVFMFLFALAVIVASRASTSSPSTSTLKKLIVAVAMCNVLVVYVPTFILYCLVYNAVNNESTNILHYDMIYWNVLIFTNLHLIFDGLQCALVLKLPPGEEQQQQQQELQQQQQWRRQQSEPQQQQQWRQQQWQPQQQQQWRQQEWEPQQQQQWRQQEWEPQQQQQWRQQQWQPQQQQQWRRQQSEPQQQQQWRQQQWQPQQQQQWRQQQWQPQQQQKLGFQNGGFSGSTNVYQ